MKFCQKCGNQMQDNEKFCTACGAEAEEAEAASPAENQEVVVENAPAEEVVKNNFFKDHIGALVAALAAFIAVLVLVCCIASGSGAKGVAKKYVKAMTDPQKMDSYMLINTETRLKDSAKDADMSLNEYLDEYYDVKNMREYWKEQKETYKDNLSDEYGKGVKVTVKKVKDVDKYTSKELKELRNKYEDRLDNYDMDADKIKAAADIEIKAKISGKDDSETNTITITLVKYKGAWKVISMS